MASFALFLLLLPAGCDYAYPEVVVINNIDRHVVITNIGFNGCQWSEVLTYGQATPPQRCLVGSDQVHFQLFDGAQYVQNQLLDASDDTLSGPSVDNPTVLQTPIYYNWETIATYDVSEGGFYRFEIDNGSIQQDFSIPGPFGH